MYSDRDIYVAFRKAQANYLSRPYRLPKDWEKFKLRMAHKNHEALTLATKKFNGTWYKIDPERYFDAGFSLYGKKFTYIKFFEKKVMKKYISQDKMQKRETTLSKKALVESAKFVKRYMSTRHVNPKISLVRQYTVLREGNMSLPVYHYIKGHIDKFFLVWLMRRGLVKITDDERAHVPYIVEKYREYLTVLNKVELIGFLEKLRELI